ncbi:MAG: hypothetical protein DIJKHBIC_03380 [Thermoanaerobaculia bacterium]|nr:hypothetical protein [Thermoanaerobaculia bacterium]
MKAVRFLIAAVLASFIPLPLPASEEPPRPTPLSDPGSGVQKGREKLSSYRWRVRTEMRVDDDLRITKLEDVHIAPDGGLAWDKTVKYERQPPPTPFPYADPRRSLPQPPSEKDEDIYFEQGYSLIQLYARVSPSHINAWASGAKITTTDPDRSGHTKISGRGLVRRLDEAVVYLDSASRQAVEIEVKTTVTELVKDIAFLRVQLEPLAERRAESPIVAPRKIFLNMNRGTRRIVIEMTFVDFRKWT